MNKCSIAIIPTRGGSKRIPKKNIKLFNGKPIIAYSIEAARKAKLFHRIIVSTDSEEIAEVAEKYGAEVPFMRPPELADDHTGTEAAILHALNWLIDRRQAIDYFCCIYATAPFILPEYIRKGFEYYAESYTEVRYRRHDNLLWKTDFAGLYLGLFEDLELVKEKRLKYLENENVDTMFLIRKRKKR